MKSEGELIEVRIVGRQILSGYFKSVDTLISQIERFSDSNIYFVLNKISDACYSREQRDKFVEKPKSSTSDSDIENREWFIVDIDPIRPTGVSASNEEKEGSKKTINKIFAFLRDFGFSEPIICDSGNGFHLLYKISIENTKVNAEILKTILLVLDMYFSNEICSVDKTMFNASRITKLYGTVARKGNNTEERPHRESGIIRVPTIIKETPIVLLKKLADLYPQPERPTFNNNYGKDKFDLDSFIQQHGIQVTSEQPFSGGTKYILDHCLFDESHKGKDAAIFKLASGTLAYRCLHDSCSSYLWKDVRLLYEPNAYDNKFENNHNQKPYMVSRITKAKDVKPQIVDEEKGKKF
jgi:hypothetical protein